MPAELALEDGSVRPVTIRAARRACPPIGQPGYHRLRFADREITLAVAPPRCVTLDDIGAGARLWGVAVQIYSLRRAGDGGIGDAGAVRDLAEAAARAGRRCRGAQPGAQPVRRTIRRAIGPYSPSSRLFLNPLLADPAAVFGADRRRVRQPGAQLGAGALIDWPARGAREVRPAAPAVRRLRHVAHSVARADVRAFVRDGGEASPAHAALRGRAMAATSALLPPFLQWLAARSFAAAQQAARGGRHAHRPDQRSGDRHGPRRQPRLGARNPTCCSASVVGAPPDIFNPQRPGLGPHRLLAAGAGRRAASSRSSPPCAPPCAMPAACGSTTSMGLMRLWLVPHGAPASEGAYLAYPLDDLLRLLALESHRHRRDRDRRGSRHACRPASAPACAAPASPAWTCCGSSATRRTFKKPSRMARAMRSP